MQGWNGEGALQQHQDGGEMMEVMDGECRDIAGKEHCCSKMVGDLLEVFDGECKKEAEKKQQQDGG